MKEKVKTFFRFFTGKRGILDKRSKSGKIIFGIFFVIFLAYALTLLYPLFWMLMNSLRDTTDYNVAIATRKPFSLDIKWEVSNYINVMRLIDVNGINYAGMIFNSVWITLITAFLGVFMPTVVSYCLQKYKFRGRGVLYGVAIFSMILPIVGNLGASFKLSSDLHIYNTPLQIILPNLAGLGGFNFLLMYGFFKNVPWSYAEAVYMDGGSDFTVFFRIMIPMTRSMMLLLGVMAFMGSWNEYMNLLLFMPDYPTLAVGMFLVSSTLERTGQMPVYYAGLVLTMIPVLVLFILFSNQLLSKITISGLKG